MPGDPGRAPTVRLAVPAHHRFLQMVRVAAASLGSDVLEDYDAIDDLRLAVDELCVAAVEAARPGSDLELVMTPLDGELLIAGCVEAADDTLPQLSDVAQMLLATTVDRYSLARDGGHVRFSLLAVRRR